jgi:hypothetical protein
MVITEYLRIMTAAHLPVTIELHEFLFQNLIQRQLYSQVHQLLQFRVIQDSTRIAQRMISLSSVYKAFYQLALDMLKRLGRFDLIIDTMLDHHQVCTHSRAILTLSDPCGDSICA